MMTKMRYLTQAAVVALMAYIGWRHQALGGGPTGAPPLDAYCPFGGISALPLFLTNGNLPDKLAFSNFWILGALLLTVILAGAIFCGWLCPLGALGEWIYAIRRKLFRKSFEPSEKVAGVLGYGRYLMLALIVYMTWQTGRIWFESYDPFKLIFHFVVEDPVAWVIVGLFVVGSLLIERIWCRFLCPLGALLGPLSRISFFGIRRQEPACVHCKACDRACPTAIAVETAGTISDTRCLSCFRCVESCPAKGALTIGPRWGWKFTLKPVVVAAIAIALFAVVLAGAQTSGVWNAFNPKMKQADQVANSVEIKGWMKWSDVVKAMKLDEAKLIKELNLPADFDREKTIKQLGQQYGFSDDKFKEVAKKIAGK